MLGIKLIDLAPVQVRGEQAEMLTRIRAEKVQNCINKMGSTYLLHPNNRIQHVGRNGKR